MAASWHACCSPWVHPPLATCSLRPTCTPCCPLPLSVAGVDPNHLVTVGEEGFFSKNSSHAQEHPQPESGAPATDGVIGRARQRGAASLARHPAGCRLSV